MIRLFMVAVVIMGVCFFCLAKLNAETKEACETQTTLETSECIIMATE